MCDLVQLLRALSFYWELWGAAKLNTHLSRPKKNANKVDFWIEPRKKLGQQFIRILAISHKFCRHFRGFLISFSIQGSAGYYVCLIIIIDIVAYKAVLKKNHIFIKWQPVSMKTMQIVWEPMTRQFMTHFTECTVDIHKHSGGN